MPPPNAIQKKGLSSLFMTHRLNVMYAPVKFHEYFPYGLGVMARTRSGTDRRFRSYGPDTVYYMELSQGKIIQKQKKCKSCLPCS